MARKKNRVRRGGLVHYVRRYRNEKCRVLSCDGLIIYNATDADIPLTCLWCVIHEQTNYQPPRFFR